MRRTELVGLPFPILGSLNGVHMFCRSHGVDLTSTATDNRKIVWKDYHNSLSLVVIGNQDGSSDVHMTTLLDLIFNAMVLLYGLEDATNIKHVERFKREIKVCYKLIDRLLGHSPSPTFGDLSRTVDVISAPENVVLQSYIDAFAEAADSPYGCLLIAGKVAVATDTWWTMSSTELVLLPMLVLSLPQTTSQDIPIFLPDISPTIERFWSPAIESLRSLCRLHPRNFPLNISLDANILGFVIINSSSHKCLCSVFPHTEGASHRQKANKLLLCATDRHRVLQSFYKSVMGHVWPAASPSHTSQDNVRDLHSRLTDNVQETYICTENYKCYVLHNSSYYLFVLYSTTIPTYAMRSVTEKTFNILLKDKNINV
ncbi:hypothetical protein LSH36_280g03034 [Paralvinella palmiformis]|uniref:Fuzzy n=1 Tax=Paralvinella palmiformis TaxID=53620 RepID=A0AAD9N3E3_9ANNE|nr:hypothetical protein LSH36_280g03034 [Paralvinella palmiformis]